MFGMTFKQIRERAQFLRNLLDLPPLSKRINEMRYVATLLMKYYYCIYYYAVEVNNVEYRLLFH